MKKKVDVNVEDKNGNTVLSAGTTILFYLKKK
jgi:hypothetical protein